MRRRLLELAQAFALLTRLPMHWLAAPIRGRPLPQPPPARGGGSAHGSPSPCGRGSPLATNPADCIWAYPIVGGVVGAIGGGAYWLARGMAMPAGLAAIWALAAMLFVTGGFHDDGLADTADGFAGGATRLRKLEIMRDSRIGTFGALALVLSLAVRGGAIVAMADRAKVAAALVVAGALGRGAIVGLVLLLRPARADGLGATLNRPPTAAAAAAIGIAAVAALVLLPAPLAAGAILLAAASSVTAAWLSYAQIGGHTGDVLGAGEQITECVVLTLLGTALAT